MSSNFTVTSIGLFLFKSFEERGHQSSVFQNYFKTNLEVVILQNRSMENIEGA